MYILKNNFEENKEKAIEINEGVLDTKHPNLATSYANLALIYVDLDDDLLAIPSPKDLKL